MVRLAVSALLLALLAATPAAAHPAPFTFLDIRIQREQLELSLVAHVFDVAHDVGLQKPEQLFETAVLAQHGPQFAALLASRITFTIDGQPVPVDPWTVVEPLPDRQSIRLASRAPLRSPPGVIALKAYLFPYDTAHQTFVNFHDGDRIASQSILDAARQETRFYAGTPGGSMAAARMVAPRAMLHLVSGLEHFALITGLLLLAASRRQVAMLALAFTAGHLVTATLGAFAVILPPQYLIEPALALAIVYVGADNLMATGGRDVRAWMALAMGSIHGFSVAALLRTLSLSRPALAWSVLSAHVALAVGLLVLAFSLRAAIEWARQRLGPGARTLVLGGSLAVMLVGVAWFVQQVFFPSTRLPGFMARL